MTTNVPSGGKPLTSHVASSARAIDLVVQPRTKLARGTELSMRMLGRTDLSDVLRTSAARIAPTLHLPREYVEANDECVMLASVATSSSSVLDTWFSIGERRFPRTPVIVEADPISMTLNLLKPLDELHVHAGRGWVDGDRVELFLDDRDDATFDQTVPADGAPVFTLPLSDAWTAGQSTIRCRYRVTRQGHVLDSDTCEVTVVDPPLSGSASFAEGKTSDWPAVLPPTIDIPAGLPDGTVIHASNPFGPNAQTSLNCTGGSSLVCINQRGPQPAVDGDVFATGIPGLGFRGIHNGVIQTSGPTPTAGGTFGNAFGRALLQKIELVKYGTLPRRCVLPKGPLLLMAYGANRVSYGTVTLASDTELITR